MIPNQAWSIDITYISIRRGFLYLTAIIDWHSRWADNIMIERWFRSFKYEEAYLTQYKNIKDARTAIGQYIHTYNFERRHSALDYQTPAECYYPAMLLPYVALHKWNRGEFHYLPSVPCNLSTISVHYKNLRFLS